MSNEVNEVNNEVYVERRKRWTAALRSGEYKQADGYLNYNGSYCCLGVACDLYMKEVGQGEWKDSGWDNNSYAFMGKADLPPEQVMEWLGLSEESGTYCDTEGLSYSLADENDNGASFSDIADTIDSNPKGLFNV